MAHLPLTSLAQPTMQRMSWSEVRKHFHDHWVELIEYQWEWEAGTPRWVRVRNIAATREELLSKIGPDDGEGERVILLVKGAESLILTVNRRGDV